METLNRLTRVVTAFNSWNEFVAAMETGYVPTMYPRTRREAILIKVVRANGFRVWSGK